MRWSKNMADGEIALPAENMALDWQRYYMRLDFYPAIKLTRRDGLSFAGTVSEYLEIESVHPGVSEWKIVGGASCDGMHLQIAKHSITLDVHEPPNSLEWYEHRFEPIIKVFGQTFSPHVALRRNATVSCLLDLPADVDARSFLGGWVMLMHPHKLAPIERPLHVLGARLFFPPFEEDSDEPGQTRKTDWGVNLRVESCFSDPGKLFLEADADWDEAMPWDDELIEKALSCIGVATRFVSDKVIKFLRQPPLPDNDEGANDVD